MTEQTTTPQSEELVPQELPNLQVALAGILSLVQSNDAVTHVLEELIKEQAQQRERLAGLLTFIEKELMDKDGNHIGDGPRFAAGTEGVDVLTVVGLNQAIKIACGRGLLVRRGSELIVSIKSGIELTDVPAVETKPAPYDPVDEARHASHLENEEVQRMLAASADLTALEEEEAEAEYRDSGDEIAPMPTPLAPPPGLEAPESPRTLVEQRLEIIAAHLLPMNGYPAGRNLLMQLVSPLVIQGHNGKFIPSVLSSVHKDDIKLPAYDQDLTLINDVSAIKWPDGFYNANGTPGGNPNRQFKLRVCDYTLILFFRPDGLVETQVIYQLGEGHVRTHLGSMDVENLQCFTAQLSNYIATGHRNL